MRINKISSNLSSKLLKVDFLGGSACILLAAGGFEGDAAKAGCRGLFLDFLEEKVNRLV